MDLFVILNALVLDVILQHCEVAVLADRIEIVAVRPELPAPQEDFHLGVSFEHLDRCDALDRLHHP